MEEKEILANLADFFANDYYTAKINESIRSATNHIIVNFSDISKYNIELAEDLINDPERIIELAEFVLKRVYDKTIKVRVVGLPETEKIAIWEIREHTNRFIKLVGYVLKIGDILIRPMEVTFECSSCSNRITIKRKSDFDIILPPTRCGCGAKKVRFNEVAHRNTMFQQITIEEDIMELDDKTHPRSKTVYLQDDLTSKDIDGKIRTGQKIVVNGWLKTQVVNQKTGDMDTYMVANSIEFLERGWESIKITEQDIERCREIAADPELIPHLKQSILPTIHGEEMVKEGLLLQAVGSPNVYSEKGILEDRGTIHIALVGEPGTGKSYSVRKIGKFHPIYRFSVAQTATGRGLIAACVHDKELNKHILIPGVIPTCHKGLCAIDELDKMAEEDYGYLNNAMNDLKVHIDKVVHGVFDTDTSILATMNPTGRIFDTTGNLTIYEQIGLPADLLDRFDLIFVIFARQDEDSHKKIFRINSAKRRNLDEEYSQYYTTDEVIKYFAYARRFDPILTKPMEDMIEQRVIGFMRPNGSQKKTSNRIFGVILRIIFAYARLRLHVEVKPEDLNSAMDILTYSFREQGLLKDGLFDFTKTEHINMDKVNIASAFKTFIQNMEVGKLYSYEDVYSQLQDFKIPQIDEQINKFKNIGGEIYEPKNGFIQKI